MKKKTNKMRVQLDFVVEFNTLIESTPMGSGKDVSLLYDYLAKALMARNVPGMTALLGGGKARFSLDYRP